ncbi:MAG: biotin/lipoyl-containing protein [Chloroflexota bacterium]
MATNFRLSVRGKAYTVEVEDISHSPVIVRVNGETYEVQLEEAPDVAARVEPAEAPVVTPAQPQASREQVPATGQVGTAAAPPRAVVSPMPGKVLSVKVKPGDMVKRGDEVCVIESMKMQQSVKSQQNGRVKAVRVAEGQAVSTGQVLIELE